MAIKVGTRVTKQPRKWHDGTPVDGWPRPEFCGTVQSAFTYRGLRMGKVKWDTGRVETETFSSLAAIN